MRIFLRDGRGDAVASLLVPTLMRTCVIVRQLVAILPDDLQEFGAFPPRVGLVPTMPASFDFWIRTFQFRSSCVGASRGAEGIDHGRQFGHHALHALFRFGESMYRVARCMFQEALGFLVMQR